MGRRRESGFFGSLIKSVLGVGTSVNHKTDWLGREQKVVKHHDSGKKKTYTHGTGIFGNKTTTRTSKDGKTVEKGTIRKNLIFPGATEYSKRSDGTEVKRSYSPGLFRNHVTTTVSGDCFKCDGTGEVEFDCRKCDGTGVFTIPERECHTCNGTGKFYDRDCNRCNGTGVFALERDVDCNRCDGTGKREATCNRCDGSGSYSRTTYR